MSIRKILVGTLTLIPGTGQTAKIHLPAGYGPVYTAPDLWLSRVEVSDPVNVSLFRVDKNAGIPMLGGLLLPSTTAESYSNIWATSFQYTLTGVSDVDVDFTFVWSVSEDAVNVVDFDTVD